MHIKSFAKVVLVVISMASYTVQAGIIEGNRPPGVGPAPYPGGGGPRPPRPGPGPRPPGGGGLHPRPPHPGNPHPGHPGHPRPPHPGHPGHPRPPHHPGPPHHPPHPRPPVHPRPPPPYYPRPPQPPPYYPPAPITEYRNIYINRNVVNERIDLRLYAGLRMGDEVLVVRANTRPTHPGSSTVQLLVDGRVVAQQYDPQYQIVLYPQNRLVLGSYAHDLQLWVSGSLYIDNVTIEVRRH